MLEWMILGGSMMWFLLACSLAGVAVVLDRWWAFWRYGRVDNRALRSNLFKLLREEKVVEAANLCASTGGPVAAVMLVGLQTYARHKSVAARAASITAVMKESMQDYSAVAISAVEKRMVVMSLVANAAPLFGMCGTVTGMITAFGAMSKAKGVDAGTVAAGISEALITTAAGLLIALFVVFPYWYFVGRSEQVTLEIDESIGQLIDFVAIEVESKEMSP
jgi:biopolymer transport protein ExbB